MYPKRLYPLPIQVVPYSEVTSSYYLLGTTGAPVRIARWVNSTDQDIIVSWDGVNEHQILIAGSFILIDISANKIRDDGLFIANGQNFWIKQSVNAPSVGSIYLETYIAVGAEQTSTPPRNP